MRHPTPLDIPASPGSPVSMSKLRLLAGSVMLATLAGCGGGGGDSAVAPPPTGGAPASVERGVMPKTVDNAVTVATEEHVAINPSPNVGAVGKLFVFLPGTKGVPDLYRLILEAGAKRGYHAIGLNYPNDDAVGELCLGDTDCFWNVRSEIITGQDFGNVVTVGLADAIVTRLTKLIAYLNSTAPNEGWGQYLKTDGSVDWTKIVVGGHSQGGGHAGVMAKRFDMNRVCYFASPPDTVGSVPAAWISGQPNVTAASKQFGFASLTDGSVPYSELSGVWQQLGLAAFGAAVSVDGNTNFGSTHMLTTNATPAPSSALGDPNHGMTVRDTFTPKTAGGAPVFDAAWAYLCFR